MMFKPFSKILFYSWQYVCGRHCFYLYLQTNYISFVLIKKKKAKLKVSKKVFVYYVSVNSSYFPPLFHLPSLPYHELMCKKIQF